MERLKQKNILARIWLWFAMEEMDLLNLSAKKKKLFEQHHVNSIH